MTPEQIAADVSARYGIPVAPNAVKIIPQGVTSEAPRYVWNGRELKAIDPQENPIRRMMNAQYNSRRKGEKLAKAEKPRSIHPQIIRSQERQAETLQLIAQGYTVKDLAAHYKIAENTARKFLAKWGMKASPSQNVTRKPKMHDRIAKLHEFTKDGDKTIRDVADFLGISWKAAQTYCINHGIPYRTKFKAAA